MSGSSLFGLIWLLFVLPDADVMTNLEEVALYSSVASFTLPSNKVVAQMLRSVRPRVISLVWQHSQMLGKYMSTHWDGGRSLEATQLSNSPDGIQLVLFAKSLISWDIAFTTVLEYLPTA